MLNEYLQHNNFTITSVRWSDENFYFKNNPYNLFINKLFFETAITTYAIIPPVILSAYYMTEFNKHNNCEWITAMDMVEFNPLICYAYNLYYKNHSSSTKNISNKWYSQIMFPISQIKDVQQPCVMQDKLYSIKNIGLINLILPNIKEFIISDIFVDSKSNKATVCQIERSKINHSLICFNKEVATNLCSVLNKLQMSLLKIHDVESSKNYKDIEIHYH